jgi:chorismate-pyruvate lyase
MLTQDCKFTDDTRRTATFLSLPVESTPDAEAKRALWRRLSATDHALLGTDGTFMTLLAALSGEPLLLRTLSQTTHRLREKDALLQLDVGQPVLSRRVLMHRRFQQAVVAYAESSVAVGRLDASLRRDLEGGDKPLGLVLRRNSVETFRELLDWGLSDPQGSAGAWMSSRELLFRTYRIRSRGWPIAIVTEHFAPSTIKSPGCGSREDQASEPLTPTGASV